MSDESTQQDEEPTNPDAELVQRIRDGDQDAWDDLVSRYEGRLMAFAESRLRRRQTSEDVVQETFIGFLNSLPNYDGNRPLESYLFTICHHKLTDQLRRAGRRPTLPLSSAASGSSGTWEIPGYISGASSIIRDGERRRMEESSLVEALKDQLAHWQKRQDWTKVMCMELLFVRGRSNKDVAEILEITEQQVANYKFDFLQRLKTQIKKQGLPREIFPELFN
jgi:RNA polymerase sigma-70 factor (ECF subfamily)